MPFAAKRPRKFCTKCKCEFSDRHFRRHVETCSIELPFSKTFSDSDESIRDDDVHEEALFSDDEEVTYKNYDIKKKTVAHKTFCNINEEDAETFFDNDFENSAESLFSSDSDSDIEDTDIAIDTDIEEQKNVCESESNYNVLTQVICTILVLWQSVYNVSDLAVEVLLRLLSTAFSFLCNFSAVLQPLVNVFPKNLYSMSKILASNKVQFSQYVVCRKCFTLYDLSDCFVRVEGRQQSRLCNHICYPNHRLQHMRKQCKELLLKDVGEAGVSKFVPFKTYCYKSIKSSLETFVNREDFEDKCESWRYRHTQENVLHDIYDGMIWKDFNGRKYNFLTEEGNYGLMLNVDWFQPFKHTCHSVGAIYISFLNLPREERFKRENIVLIGIIPDMKKEPPTNTFLQPLVDELYEAWHEGFFLKSKKSGNQFKKFRLALLCVGCDVPASRKLCGFYGHMANLGCNKCEKLFPGGLGEKTFGGFDRSSWPPRTNSHHREVCRQISKCSLKSEKEKLEKKHGVRVSCLLDLDYFDPIRMTPIDPMHNLFLGTAKHMISVWKTKMILKESDFLVIQEKISNFFCPSDVGKLPKKFSSSYGSFNADQWKNWTLLFSVYALKNVIPDEHLECWRKFVLACRRLCSRYISLGNAKVADGLLISFCKKFEELYGQEFVTPNMHLHGHLLDCMFDFGPVYSFWLFSFERENGILGSYPTNRKGIETQIMKKYLKESWARERRTDFCFDNKFLCLFDDLSNSHTEGVRGTLHQQLRLSHNISIVQKASIQTPLISVDWSRYLCQKIQG